jgi:acetyltransferase-like isoleucine patch superfamily enzyme
MTLSAMSYAHRPEIPFQGTVTVGKYTSIAAGCLFLCGAGATHPPALNRRAVANHNFGIPDFAEAIEVGSDVWIGSRCVIMGGVRIGDGAIVGAGTVVTRNIAPYAVVVGAPPRITRYRFEPAIIERLLRLKWWNWPASRIAEARTTFGDVEQFLERYDPPATKEVAHGAD